VSYRAIVPLPLLLHQLICATSERRVEYSETDAKPEVGENIRARLVVNIVNN